MPAGAATWRYVFPALAIALVALYFAYGALDRAGLETREAEARVTQKTVTTGTTTYNTNIVGGRALTQASETPGGYFVGLDLDGEATGAFVAEELYRTLSLGDVVRVRYQRTRFSNAVLVTDVTQ